MLEDIFSGDDGVIDHNTENENKGEERNQIDGNIEMRHDREGAQKGYWNTDTHPDSEGEAQEKSEHHEHQRTSETALSVSVLRRL